MWIVGGMAVPMAAVMVDLGWRACSTYSTPPSRGQVKGIDRDGRLDPDLQVRRFRFGRSGEFRDSELFLEFRDRSHALNFLRHFQVDRSAMATLRYVVSAVPTTYSTHSYQDHEVLELLAGYLVTRWVSVAVELEERPKGGAGSAESKFATSEPSRIARTSPQPSQQRREPPPPPAPDPLMPDGAVVGCDCLRDASRDGIPFILMDAN
jgi:hypothetical protein